MVYSGHIPGHGAGLSLAPGWAGVDTTTLREVVADQAYRRPVLLDHHLLLLVTVGHGTHEVDFRTHPCRPGTLIWARPGQVIRYGGQPGLDAIVVCWDAAALAELDSSGASTAAFGPTYWQLAGEDEDAVINEVSQLVVDCQRHRSGERAADLLRHQLTVLLLRLALLPDAERYPGGAPGRNQAGAPGRGQAGAPGRGQGSGPGRGQGGAETALGTFQRLREEVEQSYGRTRRVEDYAERLGCSVRTLTRACLAVTGRSAKQVIDDRVTLQAMRLLAATDAPIADIGRRLGFPEPTNFGRFFHREVGQSPGSFRAGLGSGGRQRLPEQRGPVRSAAFTPFEGGPLP